MSFRDVRNLLESLRTLGFPRLVSMENFREPNFPLVAEILRWLTYRYDPTAHIPGDVDTEQDRVIFIKAVAKFMVTKANLKLNTKKLYRADGHAVKELLKLSSLLMTAIQTSTSSGPQGADGPPLDMALFDLGSKLSQMKATRTLASEITSRGATLHDLLGREVELRADRTDAIARPLDVDQIEVGVQKGIDMLTEEVQRVGSQMDNLGADEANLASKIEKKTMDLERNNKRLRALESVRPAFMDEYEKLEADLQVQYEVYIDRFRNLGYLENQLEEFNRAEQDKFEQTEQTLKQLHEKMVNDELGRGDGDGEPASDIFNADTDSAGSDEEFMPGNHEPMAEFDGDMGGGTEDSAESDDSMLSGSEDDFLGGGDLDDLSGSDNDSLSDDF